MRHARDGHRVRLFEASAVPFALAQSRFAGAMLAPWCEAEAAELAPRAAMMAAPRCWTVLMNSPSSQARSEITSVTGWPLILALVKSGYWVAEWFPRCRDC